MFVSQRGGFCNWRLALATLETLPVRVLGVSPKDPLPHLLAAAFLDKTHMGTAICSFHNSLMNSS